jgi:hypothetical protein
MDVAQRIIHLVAASLKSFAALEKPVIGLKEL